MGEQSAVVWKRLKRRPLSASLLNVGVSIAPPKGVVAPNPISSISTITTFGAPAGASTWNGSGFVAFRASISVICGWSGGLIGRTDRSISADTANALMKQKAIAVSMPLLDK